jgi:hypothetical protein
MPGIKGHVQHNFSRCHFILSLRGTQTVKGLILITKLSCLFVWKNTKQSKQTKQTFLQKTENQLITKYYQTR